MILFLKSSSTRRVVNEDYSSNVNYNKDYSYKGSFEKNVDETCSTLLTVWRKSLLVNCSGFTVIDCKGNLVIRVDNYGCHPSEIVLMDGCGKSVLTMRRQKTMRLVDDWLVYEGEANDQNKPRHKKQPVCYVKKNVSILQTTSNILASVYVGKSRKSPTFIIEGSYPQRSCKIVDKSSKTIVAEIKRKEATNGSASFGLDVFQLVVVPGFDTGFAMTLVLLLDQMYS